MRIKILIIALIIGAASINAQDIGVDTGYDVAMKYGTRSYSYTGTAADTLGTGDSTWTYTVFVNTQHEIQANVYLDIDSVGGTSAAANRQNIVLKGKEFVDDAYTPIDTVIYQGTADTTFKISLTSDADYRYIQIAITGDSDELKTEIQKAYFSIIK